MHDMTRIATATWVAAFALAGCGGGNDGAVDLPFITVEQSAASGIATAETAVARSPADFAQLWARHTANRNPAPPPPAVNFDAMQVAGVFLGQRPSGCYSVAVTRVTQRDGRTEVAYREEVPPAGTMCTAALTQPMHLVAITRATLPLVFVAQ